MCLFWIIWHARNKFVIEGAKLDPGILMAKAEAVRGAYKRTQFPDMLNDKNLQKEKQDEWVPPPPGWVKINVDAATDTKRKFSSLRAMIRDSIGKCTAAAIKPTIYKCDVLYAEAEAIKQGVCIDKETRLLAVILETNSQVLADLINNKGGNMTEIHWIISDIQALMNHFSRFVVRYVPRSCNTNAHLLAKMALRKTDPIVWKENFPPGFKHVFSVLV